MYCRHVITLGRKIRTTITVAEIDFYFRNLFSAYNKLPAFVFGSFGTMSTYHKNSIRLCYSISQIMKLRYWKCRVRIRVLVRLESGFAFAKIYMVHSMSRPKVIVLKTKKGIYSWFSEVPLC